MKLYLLSQTDQNDYDTFDSCVVAAKNEDDARMVHPYDKHFPTVNNWLDTNYTWANKPENVNVTLIGTAIKGTKRGVICSSFNAG